MKKKDGRGERQAQPSIWGGMLFTGNVKEGAREKKPQRKIKRKKTKKNLPGRDFNWVILSSYPWK